MKAIWITEAKYEGAFRIFIRFNDGANGIVDLKNKLEGSVFEELNDQNIFKNFRLNDWTIEWPNGADLAPEFLYDLITADSTVSRTE